MDRSDSSTLDYFVSCEEDIPFMNKIFIWSNFRLNQYIYLLPEYFGLIASLTPSL